MVGFNSTGMDKCCLDSCWQLLERKTNIEKVNQFTAYWSGAIYLDEKLPPVFQCECKKLIELDENDSYRIKN